MNEVLPILPNEDNLNHFLLQGSNSFWSKEADSAANFFFQLSEDSESGTIAIRAAGIGVCVAVPFADTTGHDLTAATYILHGQLPETILAYNCFLDPEVVKS